MGKATIERFMDRKRIPLQFQDLGLIDGKYVTKFIINGEEFQSELAIDGVNDIPQARTDNDQKVLREHGYDLDSVNDISREA